MLKSRRMLDLTAGSEQVWCFPNLQYLVDAFAKNKAPCKCTYISAVCFKCCKWKHTRIMPIAASKWSSAGFTVMGHTVSYRNAVVLHRFHAVVHPSIAFRFDLTKAWLEHVSSTDLLVLPSIYWDILVYTEKKNNLKSEIIIILSQLPSKREAAHFQPESFFDFIDLPHKKKHNNNNLTPFPPNEGPTHRRHHANRQSPDTLRRYAKSVNLPKRLRTKSTASWMMVGRPGRVWPGIPKYTYVVLSRLLGKPFFEVLYLLC